MKEIVLVHFQSLYGSSNCDAFWENEGKIHEGNFQGFQVNEHLWVATSRSFIKCLKSNCEIVFTVSAGWNSATWTWNELFLRGAL